MYSVEFERVNQCVTGMFGQVNEKITFDDLLMIIIDDFGMTTGKKCAIIKFPL